MQVTSKRTKIISLNLTEEEAEMLKDLVQNPASTMSPVAPAYDFMLQLWSKLEDELNRP